MIRILRGAVLLAVSAALGACSTEPDQVKGGAPDHIGAEPGVVIVDQADSQSVKVRLVDEQGTSLLEPITVSNIGAGITVRADSAFRPIFDSGDSLVFNPNTTELRFYVGGGSLVKTSFDISAGGKTLTVPVTVTPTIMEATVAPVPADITAPVTITAPAGLTFGPNAAILGAGGVPAAYITSFSSDNTSVTVTPIPGAPLDDFTVNDVHPAYSPSLSLNLPTTADLGLTTTVGAGFSGTDDPATAPVIIPAIGVDRGLIDVGQFPVNLGGGVLARFYTMVVPADGKFSMSLSWDGGEDLGLYLADNSCNDLDIIAGDAHGSGGSATPETTDETNGGDLELAAGTYCVAILNFDHTTIADPAYFNLLIHQTE